MTTDALDRFVEAFNQRELPAIRETLAEDAIAQVTGAPFPHEVGRDAIAEVSLPYLFDSDMMASVVDVEGERGLVLRTEVGRGPVDVVIAVGADDRGITRIDYVVAPHEPVRFAAICEALGLQTTSDESPDEGSCGTHQH